MIMVDNTFLGPAFQHPLLLGADICLYSATKYLSGFSDMVAGVALTEDPEMIQKIRSRRGMFGNILQPDECWMLDSRLPTVALRMNRQSKNAQRIAEALDGHKHLSRVIYPTLFDDPEQKRIFEKQCAYPGRHVLARFQGRQGGRVRVPAPRADRAQCRVAGRRGDADLPSEDHHALRHVASRSWRSRGVTDGLVRVSVGIEDWRDLLADFEQALAATAEAETLSGSSPRLESAGVPLQLYLTP